MGAEYSMIYLTTGNASPPEMIHVAAEAGYNSISPRTIPMNLPGERRHDLAADKALFKATRQAMRETGVGLDSIENARIYDGVNIQDYEPALYAAAELGVRHILCNIWTNDQAYYIEQFQRLCELASRYGQSVDVEFVTWASIKDLKTTTALLKAAGCENVGIIVDTLHFHRSRVSLEELDTLPEQWMHCIHICDAPSEIPDDTESLAYTAREARLFPGEGVIPIKAVVERVPNAVRGIEIPHLERINRDGIVRHAKNALDITKQYLNELA